MCLKNKKECTLTTIKILGILLLVNLLLTVVGVEYAPLYWIANFTYDSLPLVQGTELVNSNIEKWGIRGQIGDIMSGHFSALAVLAVAYSITLQVEANKKMTESIEKQEEALKHTEETILQQKLSIEKQTEANLEQAKNTLQQAEAIKLQAKSIDQQNEALRIQSETLKGQIDELKASREESAKQTEEFFIQNMNVKLDRYYKLLDEKILKRSNQPEWYSRVKDQIKKNPNYDQALVNKHKKLEEELKIITQIIDFIYLEIENTSKISTTAHSNFKKEFIIRLKSDLFIIELKKYFELFRDTDSSKLFD